MQEKKLCKTFGLVECEAQRELPKSDKNLDDDEMQKWDSLHF